MFLKANFSIVAVEFYSYHCKRFVQNDCGLDNRWAADLHNQGLNDIKIVPNLVTKL